MNRTQVVNTRNRILSRNLYMSLDTKHTDLNNNIFIIGGSGAGKTFRWVKPNIMQCSSSYIFTDPKGEICRDTAGFLKKHGYEIKVLDLLEMRKSTRYNPFNYLIEDKDVIVLISNLIKNTTPKGASPSDPFWEKAEGMFLQSIFFYVWKEGVLNEETGEYEHNIGAALKLLNEADFKEDPRTGAKLDSKLDKRMNELETKNPMHPAVVNYNKSMRGAADTVRSIIISANARLAPIQTPEVIELLSEDEFDIPSIGTKKTAVYCKIPDVDKTYNFLVGLFYTQAFQQLYYTADFVYGGSLPEYVTFMLDEFANVALPDDFTSLLSTMRSRGISSVIIIQNIAQIKKLFKDDWESIRGNCDVMIFLGGNESSTHKEVSEAIGKQTIYKKSHGQSHGKNGSSSENEDALGRELMLPSELRKLKRDECIVLISGYDAVKDKKIDTVNHPLFPELCKCSDYKFDARIERAKKHARDNAEEYFVSREKLQQLNKDNELDMEEYNTQREVSMIMGQAEPDKPSKKLLKVSFAQLMALDLDNLSEEDIQFKLEDLISDDEIEDNRKKMEQEIEEELEKEHENHIDIKKEINNSEEMKLMLFLRTNGFSVPQQRLLVDLYRKNNEFNEETIMRYFNPEMSEEDIKESIDVLAYF